MKLSVEEFKKIRTVQWSSKIMNDGTMYYTPIDNVSTNLFNLDLLRLVIAPKFKIQQAITDIPNFDPTQPVIMLPNLELKVSPELETAMYFANKSPPPPQQQSLPDQRNSAQRAASPDRSLVTYWRSSLTVYMAAFVYMIILLITWCCADGYRFPKDLIKILQYKFI